MSESNTLSAKSSLSTSAIRFGTVRCTAIMPSPEQSFMKYLPVMHATLRTGVGISYTYVYIAAKTHDIRRHLGHSTFRCATPDSTGSFNDEQTKSVDYIFGGVSYEHTSSVSRSCLRGMRRHGCRGLCRVRFLWWFLPPSIRFGWFVRFIQLVRRQFGRRREDRPDAEGLCAEPAR